MKLSKWFIINNMVWGEVSGNPKFKDGTFVHTSEIVDITGNILKTNNSTYTLLDKESYEEEDE